MFTSSSKELKTIFVSLDTNLEMPYHVEMFNQQWSIYEKYDQMMRKSKHGGTRQKWYNIPKVIFDINRMRE